MGLRPEAGFESTSKQGTAPEGVCPTPRKGRCGQEAVNGWCGKHVAMEPCSGLSSRPGLPYAARLFGAKAPGSIDMARKQGPGRSQALWTEAEALDRAGDADGAVKLFVQAALSEEQASEPLRARLRWERLAAGGAVGRRARLLAGGGASVRAGGPCRGRAPGRGGSRRAGAEGGGARCPPDRRGGAGGLRSTERRMTGGQSPASSAHASGCPTLRA